MAKRTAMAVVVALVIGLVGLLGPGPTTAGAQTSEATFTVTPSTGLVDGQVVHIEGAGFPAGSIVGFLVCNVGQESPCGLRGLATATASGVGAVSLDYTVTPCDAPTCELLALPLVGGTFGAETRRPISFDGVAPVPTLTVEIDPYGTVDDAGVAVASAVISCDQATQVSVVGELSQDDQIGGPGVYGAFSLIDQCTPEEPVWAFFRITRAEDPEDDPELSAPWALGGATLSVSYRPTSPAGTPRQNEMADITLLDQEPLAAAIQTALQDPAEVELRERIVRAIQARVRQDPVFAAEWWALISG